jgi:hypothetical protein
MSRSLCRALLAAALLMSSAAAPAAGIERRTVQFAKGATSATLKGTIEGDRTVDHVLRATAGQTMRVRLESRHPALYFNVLPPGSETALFVGSSGGNDWTGTLPADGEYVVRTYLMRSAARRGERDAYTLAIGIDGPPSVPVPSAPGTDAKVPGTRFHATGQVPCTIGSAPPAQCDFGVVRTGAGRAEVTVTPPGGPPRVLTFSGATVTTGGSVKTDRQGDEWRIEVDGVERYRIPDAVVNGG